MGGGIVARWSECDGGWIVVWARVFGEDATCAERPTFRAPQLEQCCLEEHGRSFLVIVKKPGVVDGIDDLVHTLPAQRLPVHVLEEDCKEFKILAFVFKPLCHVLRGPLFERDLQTVGTDQLVKALGADTPSDSGLTVHHNPTHLLIRARFSLTALPLQWPLWTPGPACRKRARVSTCLLM